MTGKFPAVFNFNRLFLPLNRFICNQLPVLPDHCFTHLKSEETNALPQSFTDSVNS